MVSGECQADGVFALILGETSTAYDAKALARGLAEMAAGREARGCGPLGFDDFTKLVTTGRLTTIPRESDAAFAAVCRLDAELQRSDSSIRAERPGITPEDFRRLRRGWLLREARTQAHDRIHYEQEILKHREAQGPSGSPTHADHVAYLLAFHGDELAAFFRPWALPVSAQDLKAHAYIAARSGHGKSELLKTMLYGLLKARQGAILFDPHGDIAEQVVRWREFAEEPERLIYFSPYLAGDALAVVPVINPLAPLYTATDKDSAVENFIGVVSAVVGGDFEMSTRMKMLLRPCLYTLAEHEGATIYDLIDFLAESPVAADKKTPQATPWVDRAKRLLTNRAQQDILSTFFDKTYDPTKSAIRDRLRTFLASHGLDRCLAGDSTIDLARAMDAGKFIVFNLSRGKLGDETSATFGRFLLAAIQNAAMQRQGQAADERRPVFTFIDEADRLLSDSVVAIYKETRKYGLHLAIAQQITGYGMTGDMKRAVFGNSNVRIAGAGGGDVETTRDLAALTGIDRTDIEALPAHSFYVKRGAMDAVQFKAPSFLADGRNAMTASEWEAVKAYQLGRYYRHHEEAEAGPRRIVKPIGVPPPEDLPPLHFN